MWSVSVWKWVIEIRIVCVVGLFVGIVGKDGRSLSVSWFKVLLMCCWKLLVIELFWVWSVNRVILILFYLIIIICKLVRYYLIFKGFFDKMILVLFVYKWLLEKNVILLKLMWILFLLIFLFVVLIGIVVIVWILIFNLVSLLIWWIVL